MAKRYGKLPSEVLVTGWNTDIICANLAVGYENYIRSNHDGEHADVSKPSQEDMLAMIKKVRHE